MELLYFISGILTVGVVYGIILLRAVKSSHTELLTRHQSQLNISSIRNNEFEGQLGDLKILIGDIQESMKKDQYENLSEINGKLRSGVLLAETNSRKISENEMVFNKNISDAFSEIQQVKVNLKALIQDPSLLSRY